jgi:hypothetical protein
LQGGGLQYQADFSSASSRQNPPQQAQQQQDQQHSQRLPQYEAAGMVYNIAPQAHPQSPYDAHYPPRQSAAIEVLATQFGVPQYFSPDEPTGAGVSAQYLTAQVQPTPYSQPNSVNRSTAAAAFSEAMNDFSAPVPSEALEPQEFPRESSSSYDDAYNQYQQALRQTFESTRAGRLVDASQSLLEISEWLLGNAVELGMWFVAQRFSLPPSPIRSGGRNIFRANC